MAKPLEETRWVYKDNVALVSILSLDVLVLVYSNVHRNVLNWC